MINKFIMLAGFSIAVVSFAAQYTQDSALLFFIFAGVYLLLWLLLEAERRIRNSKGNFFNKYLYIFSRSNDNYTIECAESCYEYVSRHEMKYSKDIELRSCINGLKSYEDKFCWSSYSGSVMITPRYSTQSINSLASKNLWNVFEIDFGQRYKKGAPINTGFEIIGLKDDLGIAKPFLSHKSDKKVKERVMTVVIPKELKPINAKFEIYKTSETGKIISSEPLAYDDKIKGFSKTILYPRRGWTYAIVWDWGEE